MLSYQHIYHAGNLADVQKHMLLAAMLSYLIRKDKPVSYIETHAGRGLYHLDAPEAMKTGEAAAGIDRILGDGSLPADHPLLAALAACKATHGETAYPGSPLIAQHLLRPQDSLQFAALHPGEHAALRPSQPWGRAKIHLQDGFELAQSLAPPTPRRGLLLIDPSYEIKSDYDRIPGIIATLHRKWNVGIIALWYPILKDGAHGSMLRALESQNLPGALRHEVRFPPVREGHRMIGSGMFVVNAPFGTEAECARLNGLFAGLQ
jgi:23S rRNA (adenine2030-N6)-methyltransferase